MIRRSTHPFGAASVSRMDTAVPVAAGRELRHGALSALALAGAAATAVAAALGYAGAAGQPGSGRARPRADRRRADRGRAATRGRAGRASGSGSCWWRPAAAGSWPRSPSRRTRASTRSGRTAGWLVELLFVYLVLCFPTGRLPERRRPPAGRARWRRSSRVFFLPQLLLAETFPVPSPYTSCIDDCPANALFALDSEPAFVQSVMRPLGAVLVFAVMTAVVAAPVRGACAAARR